MKYSRSKRFSIVIFIVGSLLSGFCAYKGLEGATSAIFSTATMSSVGLYANKQYQQTQQMKINKTN